MKLVENVGLLKSEINLYCDLPHMKLMLHEWKLLKTKTNHSFSLS
jgi:hypothetical protein